ncbi:Outer membrane receptor proteins, mostly Fe transport [Chitinophaga sancti]|uniref:Outer membrane receptor proteins, mostly Fe transport n=2 Tax=Chitinophaga sancti TaxID=1004 RepID=A0A1K1SSX6_9BACT|nr:Outer membrane receptor proteins, mostly Fe transport [Chitinophaga sancti]
MQNSFFLVTTFVLINMIVYGQGKVKLSGMIRDTTGHPLEFTAVCLVDNGDTTKNKCVFSGTDGVFVFPNVADGSYYIKTSYTGYYPFRSAVFSISSAKGETMVLPDYILRQDGGKMLKEISVTAQKPLIEKKIDRVVLNVENSVMAKGNTALEILQSAPGVGESRNGTLSLRGKEGTMVLVNDKPTYLSAADLAELLRNTPGTNVHSIELITNPPAKYEAQGTGGIINIRMKTTKALGFNGSVNAMGGFGRYYKWNTGVAATFRTNKVNLSANYIASGNQRFNDQTVERTNINNGVITRFDQQADRVRRIGYNHFNVSIEYYPTSRSTFRLFADGSFNTATQTLYNNTGISNGAEKQDSSYMSVAPLRSNYSDFRYGASYEYKLDSIGSTLGMDFNAGRFDAKEVTQYNNAYYLSPGKPLKSSDTLRINSPIKIDIYSFNADYSRPWLNRKHVMDAGVKFTYIKTNNDFGYDSLRNGTFYSTIFSNRFIYKENVNAGYVNYNFKGDKTSVQAGLRVEQTNSEGIALGADESVKRHYLDFFPTAFIDQKLSASSTINFAYSRRIDRPSYEDLNPFVYFLDQFTFSQGNPFLKPQYSNSFEVNYTLLDKYNASLSYVRIGQVISEVVKTDPVSKTLIFSYDNLAKQDVFSLALTAPISITRWWSSLFFFNTNLNHIVTPDFDGNPLDVRRLSYNFNVNETFTIDNATKCELNFGYQSPYITGTIFYNKPQYGLDFGLSRTFSKHISASFSVKDIFHTRTRYFTSLLPNQHYQYFQLLETQIVRLTATYKFGNSKIPKVKNGAGASEEEMNRIKGAN